MWSATKARIQPWLTKHKQTLQHRPAAQMFPLGLALGGGVAAIALLGLGQLPGLLVCALLLGATIPLLRGAEPVTRQRPALPVRTHREGSLPAVSPMPPPGTAPYMVTDISGLLDMVELPGETFWMGSAEDDEQANDNEKPLHAVTVSGFAIGRVVVTRRLYREDMAESPAAWERVRDDDFLPANNVQWFDAVAFCNRLSEHRKRSQGVPKEQTSPKWRVKRPGQRSNTYVSRRGSANHLVRQHQEVRGYCDFEGLGRLEVEDQLELGGLLHGQVGCLGAFEDLVHIDGSAPVCVKLIWPIGHEASRYHPISPRVHHGQPALHGEV